MPLFEKDSFITIIVHANTSLHHVSGFACAPHAGKMKASRQNDQEAG